MKGKKYNVEYTEKCLKQLKKMDKSESAYIVGWIKKKLINCENPRIHGKGLVGDHSGEWRYRIGNYRIIADINDDTVLILLLNIGHRKNVYK
ncbi:type II toxin-antitoxin system RelE/ParE family toxin [Sebaldella sp. S0638]|uniref:type II toxin-antitoxin system RelE family toxin n=1 Tax=Sebaldella sp. S0638 TaxID=2957809 RepID=UPI00209E379C|nr:type II toxin-antitoxin system RelE/ParE family toxin [Sebaldella sp. S0638]MCP1224533.1 type II toxin-antitoxin system RelE/ParE family toxin [Sebaldella sp. S0638]